MKDDIKKSLVDLLEAQGNKSAVALDLVDKYVELLEISKSLNNDIKNRGTLFEEVNSFGLMAMKENPSVKMLVNVNKQMLSVLKTLGFDKSLFEIEGNGKNGNVQSMDDFRNRFKIAK